MKTVMERRDQRMRAKLLRMKPRNRAEALILAELALIHKSSNHTGAVKNALFERGARQLAGLK